jgi:putative DNA methylase
MNSGLVSPSRRSGTARKRARIGTAGVRSALRVSTGAAEPISSPLKHLDPVAVSDEARRESRNREVYLPPVSVYRWWARRTLAVNGALVTAFLKEHPGRHIILDPFAGGGVIPLAALAHGQRLYAQDVNPWATQGLRTLLTLPDPVEITQAADALERGAKDILVRAYGTTSSAGKPARISHTIRVSSSTCDGCCQRIRHFPHAMVTLLNRRERRGTECFLACRAGHLFRGATDRDARCPECHRQVDPSESYTARRDVTCASCGEVTGFASPQAQDSWEWNVALVERANGLRELDLPTTAEIAQADEGWAPKRGLGRIQFGQETQVLLRHGFTHWHDLYPLRQRAVVEALLDVTEKLDISEPSRAAITAAIIGSTEMAGLLSRWDRWYLKSYESMAGHRFNFTTLTAEPNVWGTVVAGRGTILRRIEQIRKAASWFSMHGERVSVEYVADSSVAARTPMRSDARVVCGSSERILLPDASVNLCLTDPPYHDDVQYSELSLPLRAWAGLSLAHPTGEAVVNERAGRNVKNGSYRKLLTRIFAEIRRVLAADGHLMFSFANRNPAAWADLLDALQGAGLRATGYAVVHSENETDSAKRNVRACTLDMILDLVPQSKRSLEKWVPPTVPVTAEATFLTAVGRYVMQVGELSDGWRDTMSAELNASTFLQAMKPAKLFLAGDREEDVLGLARVS